MASNMKITRAHYDFWCQHKTQVSWYKPDAGSAKSTVKPVSIHTLIPRDRTIDKDHTVNNLIVLLKGALRRGENLVHYMERIAIHPGTVINPKKRASLCRKWARRLGSADNRPPFGRRVAPESLDLPALATVVLSGIAVMCAERLCVMNQQKEEKL